MRKKFLALMLSALMIGATACGAKTEKKDEVSNNMKSNEEVTGKVRIYTSMYEDIIDNMKPALKKRNSLTVKLNFFKVEQVLYKQKLQGKSRRENLLVI